MNMTKKDQDNIAKLYMENSEHKYNNDYHMTVSEIVGANISSALNQLKSPDYNGHALYSHIKNIFDTLDDENIQYDPYEIEPMVIEFIRSGRS